MRSTLRSSTSIAALSVAIAGAGCASPDRTFAEGEGGAATTATGVTTGPTTGPGGGTAPGSGGAGGSGTASGELCGNGVVDTGEACDEATALCSGCLLDCPAGWVQAGDACFAVALGDVTQVDALSAMARCGALAPLDVPAVGHRAQPAAPVTAEQFAALAAACPNNGCWLGYLSVGAPGSSDFEAAASGTPLFAEAPWGPGEPSRGARELCTRLRLEGDVPVLEDTECTGQIAYSACQLSTTWGAVTDCGDGARGSEEECDDPLDEACVDCSRLCPDGSVEDPWSHACLFPLPDPIDFASASDACSLAVAGATLATPAEVEGVRILELVGEGWLGATVEVGGPSWQSGDPWTYVDGTYPLAGDVGAPGTAAVLGADGLISWVDAASALPALCEAFAP